MQGDPATCAAIVGVVLAVSENLGDPFDAVILERHVVLASHAAPERFYEVLDQGAEITVLDLRGHGRVPDAAPRRVQGKVYLAYYLDNLAARLAEADEKESASRAFEDALTLAPHAARILYNYGSFLVGDERFSEGLDYLNQAIQAGWENASAFVNRGVARWRLGDLDGARIDFDHAIALDPSHREARRNRRLLAQDANHGIASPESRE